MLVRPRRAPAEARILPAQLIVRKLKVMGCGRLNECVNEKTLIFLEIRRYRCPEWAPIRYGWEMWKTISPYFTVIYV